MTDKLELKSSHEVIYTVDVADVDSIFQGKPTDPDILTVVMKDGTRLYCDEVCPINSLQEEPKDPCKDPCKDHTDDDFESEWNEYFKYRGDVATVNVKHLAKYFFELGMQVSNKAQKGESV